MKKLHFVILLLFFCANNLLAQTPYDSFVSDAVKYPLLGKKEQSNFLVHAIDSTNAISYMSFNVKTGEASLFGHNNELIKTIVLDKNNAKWLSEDPWTKKQPNQTPYNFVSNNPISRIDPDGNTDYYYKATNSDGTTQMALLGRDENLNGTIAVVTDQKVIAQLVNNQQKFINPPTESYFELPSQINRQRIRQEVTAHYGEDMSINVRYEIGGAGVKIGGRTVEVTGTKGTLSGMIRPAADALQPVDQNVFSFLDKTKYSIVSQGTKNARKILNTSILEYTWHTHPIVLSCPSCYFLASDQDLDIGDGTEYRQGSELRNVRNNFVLAPLNNSVALFNGYRTKTSCTCGTENGGASETIPMDWFFSVPDAQTTIQPYQQNK